MAISQEVIDSIIRHTTYVDRYGAGLANRILGLIDDDELAVLVASKKNLRKSIKRMLSADKKAADKLVQAELKEMAKLEVKYLNQLTTELKEFGLSNKQIGAVIQEALEKPLVVTNNTPKDLYESAFVRKEQIATSLNQMGYLGIKDSAALALETSAMLTQFARSMQVANKTFSSSVSNELRQKAYNQSRAIDRVVMSAVLDGRTTPYCMDIDGEIYPKKEGPRPPFHPKCRTLALPVNKETSEKEVEELLSYRPEIKPGESYEKDDDTKLRSHKRQVNSGKTKVKPAGEKTKSSNNYANFLASQRHTPQGKQFILDRLGVRKGNRFIRLVGQGRSPDKLLTELVYDIEAKDLDLDGLKKRIKH